MPETRPKIQKLIQTRSGRFFTMSGRQVKNVTSVKAWHAPKNSLEANKPPSAKEMRTSNDVKELKSKNGVKYTSKITYNRLKNYGVFQVHGYAECIYPKQGVEYMNKITVTCDSQEEAKRVAKEYRATLKEQMERIGKIA